MLFLFFILSYHLVNLILQIIVPLVDILFIHFLLISKKVNAIGSVQLLQRSMNNLFFTKVFISSPKAL